jgi:hypothetical protein
MAKKKTRGSDFAARQLHGRHMGISVHQRIGIYASNERSWRSEADTSVAMLLKEKHMSELE